MKNTLFILLSLTALTFINKTAKSQSEPDEATQMQNWMAYMTPSAMHQMMQSWDGEWNAQVVSFGMGEHPDTSKGKAVNKTIMGGRYQTSNFYGSMMGQPFEGASTLAYDNHKKIFISTWVDNMGTGLMVSEGPWDEATKTITLKGKMMNAGTGTEDEFRQTMRIVDANTQISEMYSTVDGVETKWMQITYTRNAKK